VTTSAPTRPICLLARNEEIDGCLGSDEARSSQQRLAGGIRGSDKGYSSAERPLDKRADICRSGI
jgi:hypothetical protein